MVGVTLTQVQLGEELGFSQLADGFGFAFVLEGFEMGMVALAVAADAALVESEAFEFFGVLKEDGTGIGTRGKDNGFDFADAVEAVMVFGDKLGDLAFHGVGGVQVIDDGVGEVVMEFSRLRDREDAVTGGVAAGVLFAGLGFWTGGKLGVAAVCFDLLFDVFHGDAVLLDLGFTSYVAGGWIFGRVAPTRGVAEN